jgi:hypothetical protein
MKFTIKDVNVHFYVAKIYIFYSLQFSKLIKMCKLQMPCSESAASCFVILEPAF